MTKNKIDDRRSGRIDGLVKPKVRWFDGSTYLEPSKVVRSAPFRDKLEQLERRLRDG